MVSRLAYWLVLHDLYVVASRRTNRDGLDSSSDGPIRSIRFFLLHETCRQASKMRVSSNVEVDLASAVFPKIVKRFGLSHTA